MTMTARTIGVVISGIAITSCAEGGGSDTARSVFEAYSAPALGLVVWREFLFAQTSGVGGDTVVHRLPSLEVVGTWKSTYGGIRPVADLNGDGIPEQVMTGFDEDRSRSRVGWLSRLPDGDEAVDASLDWTVLASSSGVSLDLTVADLDGSGAAQRLLWQWSEAGNEAWVVPDDAADELSVGSLTPLDVADRHGLVNLDVDDDGVDELVSQFPFGYQALPLAGAFAPSVVVSDASLRDVTPRDFTGDGVVDLLLSGKSVGDGAFVLDGASAAPSSVSGNPISIRSTDEVRLFEPVGLGDINGDGQADVAVASYDRLFIFLGPLSGVATPDDAALVIPLGLNTFGAFAAADIDGDGREDLIRPELTGEPGGWDYELVVHLATDLFP